MAEKRAPKAAAKTGKAKGAGTVTPAKAASEEAADVQGSPVAPPVKPGEGEREHEAAWEAGLLASKRGTPSRPPLGYSDAEVKAWYAGYKSHANPNSEGRVEDIGSGYRKDY